MRIINRSAAAIDYRSHRRPLGLRVWKDRCQVIGALGGEWAGLGPQLELPLEVPCSVEDLEPSNDLKEVARATAFRYELEQPGTDLFEVLSKEKTFEKAIQAA